MMPEHTNNAQNSKVPLVVDAPYRTRKLLIAIAVVLGIAALIIYFWDPEFIPWLTGSTKR
jgi:hypothetical protein